ncbi:Tad domain-containing protein [Sulfitobacter sp. S0837]|uniref:TadE/TadG family type IV pilus assembly protein n=1 Tax=Sulfitobacter maritimus TaxID=2741719 RepID=UPI001581E1AE|nr:TadE/TadG family type IV pilus assembly protein [Sulfitobacter maritimus]NUH64833.1 Tad domain-containing protein [Sulfitobacter maritimus]
MTNAHCSEAKSQTAPQGFLYRFFYKEDGSITIFAVFLVLIMVLLGGVGVDLMRHERERSKVQAVADRAVLAAADLDQTLDPEEVARDYFNKAGMSEYVSTVEVDEGLNYRRVTVDASRDLNTLFMDNLGTDKLYVPAKSTAEEKINKVEISMVLDISGSMRHNRKINNLHSAGAVFIDTVLKPENEDLISVSVVPYTAQVNVGRDIMDELNVDRLHRFSYCVDFDDSEFDETAISTTRKYEHMQHFEAGYNWNGKEYANQNRYNNISNPGCPKRNYEKVYPFSQNATKLKNRIAKLQPRANTSIHLGLKWGVALLDPSFRAINQAIGGDPAFQSRPASYSDIDTLKTVILMTDGINVTTRRLVAEAYSQKDYRRHWSDFPLFYWLNENVRWQERHKYYWTKYTPTQADNLLENICDAAKAKGIVIWSIGFEVNEHGASVMKDCASSDSHFFRVEGVEIVDAFEAIARQINQLRLTQ